MVRSVIFDNTALYELMKKVRQSETSHRWRYNKAHTFCMLDNKGYSHKLRIFNIIASDSNNRYMNAPQYSVIRTLCLLL